MKQEGNQGLAHQGRGKPSNRRLPETVKTKGLKLYAPHVPRAFTRLEASLAAGQRIRATRQVTLVVR